MIAPAIGVVKIVADESGKFLNTGIVHSRLLVRQIFALTPTGGQRICMIETGRAFPASVVIQKSPA